MDRMWKSSEFTAGEWVEVRSREEILSTLDGNGQLDGLPFMPEMLQFCGQRLPVFRRAHKTCDPPNGLQGRRMAAAVHLDGLRCDGSAHGGCQAGCLMFWKDAWLKKADAPAADGRAAAAGASAFFSQASFQNIKHPAWQPPWALPSHRKPSR